MAAAGCASSNHPRPDYGMPEPKLNTITSTQLALRNLPRPAEKVPVAVYGFTDQTGMFKPSDNGQSLSRAVTQGATPILIKALQDASERSWFTVVERERLDNLLKERQIILEMRQRYLGEPSQSSNALPALLFAGVILEGAITGYDTNVSTGGAGAQYLGIGANRQYREDAVTVHLRAVSVKTGEVLLSVTSEQRVASVAYQGSIFKFVAYQELLEAEAGLTYNQPRTIAVRQAIEKAVYGLILEGVKVDMWGFKDLELGQALIDSFDRKIGHTQPSTDSRDILVEFPEQLFQLGRKTDMEETVKESRFSGRPGSRGRAFSFG